MSSPQKVLVTGGVRSGESRHAEALLADLAEVTYVAPGPVATPLATRSGRSPATSR